MNLSCLYRTAARHNPGQACSEPSRPSEGRECEACRQATAQLLLPGGRPGHWLLLLAGSCAWVLIQALALHLG